jgi:copper chaperone CopZ
MKSKIAILGVLLSLTSASAWAKAQEVTIGVKGMVCSFCAQGIERKFKTQPSVDQVKVSLGNKQVKLTLKDGQAISDETVKEILSESGYNVEKIERD